MRRCCMSRADGRSDCASLRTDACVHEQVAKLDPVSRAAGMDCECPLYIIELKIGM